jgi:hypothetical protein
MVEISYPILKPTYLNKFVLNEDYEIEGIVIKKGYETNGADIPRFFWWFVPPFKPKYLPAIIVHDYCFEKKEYKKGNFLFEKILLNIENSFTTKAMIKTVKTYTKLKYGV